MWEYRGQKRPPFAEQPGIDQESVWDYPRPPKAVPCNRTVEVAANDIMIVRSQNTVRLLETASPPTFYIPPTDVDWSQLIEVPGASFCEWKGSATYWALKSDPDKTPVGWSYQNPSPEFEVIRSYIAFYPGSISCFIDGERVRPQPSSFYGGWVTDDIVGPFKGESGSAHW